MSDAIIAHGTLIERSRTGQEDFTPVAEAKGIAVPAITQDYVEATHNQSEGGFREWIKGLKDGGELAIPANYTSAAYAQALADRDQPGPIFYRVTFPLAPGQTRPDVFTFKAFPNPQIGDSDDPGAIVGLTISLRTTGEITFEQGGE